MGSGFWGLFPCSPASQGLISCFSALISFGNTVPGLHVPRVLVAVLSCAAPNVYGGRQVPLAIKKQNKPQNEVL